MGGAEHGRRLVDTINEGTNGEIEDKYAYRVCRLPSSRVCSSTTAVDDDVQERSNRQKGRKCWFSRLKLERLS